MVGQRLDGILPAGLEILEVLAGAVPPHVLALGVGDPAQPSLRDQLPPALYNPPEPRLLRQAVHQSGLFHFGHNPPAVRHRIRRRHLRVHVFSRLQRLRRHCPHLPLPHAQANRFHPIVSQEFLVIRERLYIVAVADRPQRPLLQRLNPVVDRGDPVTRDLLQQSDPVQGAMAQPGNSNAYLVHRSPSVAIEAPRAPDLECGLFQFPHG